MTKARRWAHHTIEERQRIEVARELWRRSRPTEGTPVERYLRARGYAGQIPATIRYLPNAKHSPSALVLPAMVAAVTLWPSRKVVGVHRTFLTADGLGKATVDNPRMALGLVGRGAVRLAAACKSLAVAEGIETALSVQSGTGLPTWAALSAGNIWALCLPSLPLAAVVYIAADNDPAGLAAAEEAAKRWVARGRRVKIVVPPSPGSDWNDVLRNAAHA